MKKEFIYASLEKSGPLFAKKYEKTVEAVEEILMLIQKQGSKFFLEKSLKRTKRLIQKNAARSWLRPGKQRRRLQKNKRNLLESKKR